MLKNSWIRIKIIFSDYYIIHFHFLLLFTILCPLRRVVGFISLMIISLSFISFRCTSCSLNDCSGVTLLLELSNESKVQSSIKLQLFGLYVESIEHMCSTGQVKQGT